MIKVLHDFILLEPPLAPPARESGLIVLAGEDSTLRCRVAGIGPGTVLDNGTELKPDVKVGDIVYVPKEVVSSAPTHKHNDIKYLFVKQPQILCWESAE